MGRPAVNDRLLDAALRALAVLDIEGKLERGELTAEVEGIAAWRAVAKSTAWARYHEIRSGEDRPPPDVRSMIG